MSIYTNFEAKIRLRLDTPKPIVDMINSIININNMPYPEFLDFRESLKKEFNHPFFKCRHWYCLFNETNGSDVLGGILFETRSNYKLILDVEFREYDEEISKFLDFIKPYIVGRKKKQYIGKSIMYDYKHEGYTYYAVDCSTPERKVIIY